MDHPSLELQPTLLAMLPASPLNTHCERFVSAQTPNMRVVEDVGAVLSDGGGKPLLAERASASSTPHQASCDRRFRNRPDVSSPGHVAQVTGA